MCSKPESKQPLVSGFRSEKAVVVGTARDIYTGPGMPVPSPFLVPPDIPKFTGREKELSEIEEALTRGGAVIAVCGLWGMAGVGKSALAIHVAHRLHRVGHFQHGILWADLGASSVEDIVADFIRTFGFSEDQIPADLDGRIGLYRSLLKNKHMLVGLDNAQSDEQVATLLPNEPSVAVIVTSRKHMSGLAEYTTFTQDVDVFPLKDALDLLSQYAAERCEREPKDAKEICGLVGCLPLAIDIAGARIADKRRWSRLCFFAERLRDEHRRLDELKIGDRKERNLRAVLAISYDGLPGAQRRTFAHLALFGGGDFGSSGAMAVLQIEKQVAIERLEELVDLSLLLRSGWGGYKLHDLVRIYADERLQREIKPDAINAAKLRLEEYNALVTQAGTLGARASALVRQGNSDEAVAVYQQVLEINKRLQHRRGEAHTVGGLAAAYSLKRDWEKAIEYYERNLDLSERIGDPRGQASALGGLASVYAGKRDWEKAIEYYERNLDLSERIGDPRGQASALGGLDSVYFRQRDWERAIEYFELARRINKNLGKLFYLSVTLQQLARCYRATGNIDQALDCAEEAVSVSKGKQLQAARQLLAELAKLRP